MAKKFFPFITALITLTSCSSMVIFHPKGEVGVNEKTLILTTAILMLLVVLPAIGMTFIFAWKYRKSNQKFRYIPEWQSKKIEIAIWFPPAIIILVLAIIVWFATHRLDPYEPLATKNKPITIQVIALDWKWLFIYPTQQIAIINQMVIPTDVPVHFFLTSDRIMNSFFIPQLGSQIMTMPGMQTQLHLIANKPGIYNGISANFSGPGFTGMRFNVVATSEKEFQDWVKKVKQSAKQLNYAEYQVLTKASENNPVEYFSFVPPNFFKTIVLQYTPNKNEKHRK